MSSGLIIQTLGSFVAILALVGFAAWAKIGRPAPDLDEPTARAVLAAEFPDYPIAALWLSADRRSAIARSGALALIVYRIGDGYVARDLPWRGLDAARPDRRGIAVPLGDIAAPRAWFALAEGQAWPPMETAS